MPHAATPIGAATSAAAWLLAALLAGVSAPARAQSGPPPVTVVRATRGDVPVFASGIGTVQAFRSVLVRARVDGTLTRIAFREGQDVAPGDLLAEIDPRPYAAILDQARARRAADAARLQNARLDMARYAALGRNNFASRQQVDTQQATVAELSATVAADDAAIAAAALNLSFCRIEAPIDGVVGLKQVDVGNLVHANDTQGIVTIAQVRPISLVFTLPERELPAVQRAMAAGPAPVSAFATEGGAALSEGVLLTPANSIDTATGTIALKATFQNTDRRLWPGQFVAARIRLGTERGVVTVPDAAIQHGPDGLYVYVVTARNLAERRAVALGYRGEGRAVVTRGLAGGEDVITAGHVRVSAGAPVAPRAVDPPADPSGGAGAGAPDDRS